MQLPFSEACERNKEPILAVLREVLAGHSHVLEIGSGTGQHAVHFALAMPEIVWQPSEMPEAMPGLRRRIFAEGPKNLRAPVVIDVTETPWDVRKVDGVFTANTLHIMHWPQVEAFFAGLPAISKPGTALVEWDPFTSSILSEIGGAIEFQDIVEGENVREETDKVTGLSQRIIVEASASEKRIPALLIRGGKGQDRRYILPSGSHLMVHEGQQVSPGDVLVKIPRVEAAKTKDITGGLPRVVELFEARSPKEPAIITHIDGVVRLGEIQKGMRKVLVESDTGETREYLVPRSVHVNVQDGERVNAGDPLIDGPINPHDVLDVLGEKELQRYMTDKIQEVYRSQSVAINDKHIEVIVRQMMRSVRITEVGDTEFLIDEQVDRWRFLEENERVTTAGGRPAIGRPLLLGITKASLSTDSFISAASFQETTRVLTEAAINGADDHLRGLKENVIVGRLIPAGTGMDYYHDFHMEEVDLPTEVEEEQELFFEFGEEDIRSLPQEVMEGE